MKLHQICTKELNSAGYLKDYEEKEKDELYQKIIKEIVGSYTKDRIIKLINDYCKSCEEQEVKKRSYYKDIIKKNEISADEFEKIQKLIINTINENYDKEV